MIKILEDYPDNVLAVIAQGEVTAEDYIDILAPEVARRIETQGTLRMLYQFGPAFEGLTLGADWQDMKLGVEIWSHLDRLAVVTDVAWITNSVVLFAPFFKHPLRIFTNAEIAEAKAWIQEQD